MEFLEFLGQNNVVILYTSLDKEIAETIIRFFKMEKKGIDFSAIIGGKYYNRNIHGLWKPIKSVNNIIPDYVGGSSENFSEMDDIKNQFLILDGEIGSYYENYEDIYIPILPIIIQDEEITPMKRERSNSRTRKIKGRKRFRRQSSAKMPSENVNISSITERLENHCLFYLKQLISQSYGQY